MTAQTVIMDEEFDNTFGAFTMFDGGPQWQFDTDQTGSFNTGPAGPFSGSHYTYLETTTGAGNSTLTAPLDLSGLGGSVAPITLEFSWHMFGAAMGTLDFDVSTDGGATWINEFTRTGQQQTALGDPWVTEVVDLSAYDQMNVLIRFNGIRGASFTSDMAIDALTITANIPPCTIDCSVVDLADGVLDGMVSASTDANNCEATLVLPNPTTAGPCAMSAPITFATEDFTGGQGGWTLSNTGGFPNTAGACGAGLFSFSCQNGATFSGNANAAFSGNIASISDDDAGGAFVGAATMTSPVMGKAPVAGGTYTLEMDFTWDGGSGSFADVDVFDGAAWVNVFNITGDDAVGHISEDITAEMNAALQVRVTHDDNGAFEWGFGFDNVELTELDPAADPMTNSFNGTSNASGAYPAGTTVVTFSIPDLFGNIISCDMPIVVADEVDPVLDTNGPETYVFDLAPGACDIQVNLPDVLITDNCPLTGVVLFAEDFTDAAGAGWTASQGVPGVDLASTSGAGAGLPATPANHTAPFLLLNDDDVPGFVGQLSATSPIIDMSNPALSDQRITFDFAHRALGGSTAVAEVSGDAGATWTPINGFPFAGVNNATVTGSVDEAIPAAALTDMFQFRFSHDDAGGWQWGSSMDNMVIVASAGAIVNDFNDGGANASDLYPIGTTCVTFSAQDAQGNPGTTSICVTVNEFANPVTDLTCNDMVNFSLDASCATVITADQILEGGPYGCYDDYVVEVKRNGVWVPATLSGSDIGNVYEVRVTDPATGNSCWGNVLVEDKNAPVLDCQMATSQCNASNEPGVVTAASEEVLTIAAGGNGGAVGGMVYFDIENTGTTPLTINGLSMNISAGTMVDIFITNVAGTHVGQTANMAAWTLIGQGDATVGPFSGAFPGNGTLTPVSGVNFDVPPGVWGIALGTPTAANNYTNGVMTFAGGPMVITTGSAGNAPFGGVFFPRSFNGSVSYASTNTVSFPNGLVLGTDVFQTGNKTYRATAGAGMPVLEGCSDVTLTYLDSSVPQACATGLTEIITRKWTATDAAGNVATCEQTIDIERFELGDVVTPDDAELACTDVFATDANGNPTPAVTGGPTINGSSDGCSVSWTYEDAEIAVCDGTRKIRREWHIIDWCSNDDLDYVQIIKILDEVGPTIATPDDITISVDPFSCSTSADLPDVIVADACSRIASATAMVQVTDPETGLVTMHELNGSLQSFPGNNLWAPDTLAVFGAAPTLPLGRHTVTYIVEDDCENTSEVDFEVLVLDLIPPSISCDEHTQVAIGVDDPQDCVFPDADACTFAGVSWVDASVFDDGSYDNCGNIYFTVRRMTNPDTFGYFGGFVPGPGFSEYIRGLNSMNSENKYLRNFVTGAFEYDECLRWATPSGVNPEFPYVHDELFPGPPGPGFVLPSEFALATTYWGLGSYTPANQIGGTFTAAFPNFGLRYAPIALPTQTYAGGFTPAIDINVNTALTNDNPITGQLLGLDSIKFYCGEVGTTQTVIVRGYQVNNGMLQMDAQGQPIYNECMVDVTIVDKTRPVCQSPANVTVDCEAYDNSLWAYGTPDVYDNCCLDTDLEYNGTKGITHTASFAQFDTVCNVGRITRTFRVFDCYGNSSSCTQSVTVEYNQDYYLEFPADVTVYECDGSDTYGEPIIYDEDCELMGVSYTDEILTVVPDACYKIERTWKVTNWCTYDPNLACEYVNNPIDSDAGPRLSPFAPQSGHPHEATNADYFAQYVNQLDADGNVTANCWTYKQIIKIVDGEAPVATTTQPSCDLTPNASNYYNDAAWYDAFYNVA